MSKQLDELYIVVATGGGGQTLYWNGEGGWANFPGAAGYATTRRGAQRLLDDARDYVDERGHGNLRDLRVTRACFNAGATLCPR